MFDEYEMTQKISYRIIKNSVETSKVSHAYIIEANGFSNSLNFALALSKYLLCPFSYSNNKKCNNCTQCNKIDNGDFLELKIIDTDGMWIKKNEIDELQEVFSRKSIIGKRKIYIINNANKLNDFSANSILKFLEEPEEGIIAILIVENIKQLLPTIVSRCQILSLFFDEGKQTNTKEKIASILRNNKEDVSEILSNSIVDNVISFIKYYEKNKLNSILNMNKIWNQYFKERTEIYDAFTIMLLFYKDVLNCIIDVEINVFDDYMDDVTSIAKINEKSNIIRKINVIMELREKIKYNINNNLLMDKLIIELEGCD